MLLQGGLVSFLRMSTQQRHNESLSCFWSWSSTSGSVHVWCDVMDLVLVKSQRSGQVDEVVGSSRGRRRAGSGL